MLESQKLALQQLRQNGPKDVEWRVDGDDATIRSLVAPDLAVGIGAGVAPEQAAERVQAFMADNRDLFLLKDPRKELVVANIQADRLGGSVVRLEQTYEGLKVWPGAVTANINGAGNLTVLTGAYFPTPEGLRTQADITKESAIGLAVAHVTRLEGTAVEPGDGALLICAEKGAASKLVFSVEVRAGLKAYQVMVDASTGGVLKVLPLFCDLTGSGKDLFGVTQTLNVVPSVSLLKYYLYDRTKAMYSSASEQGVIAIFDYATPSPLRSYSPTVDGGYSPAGVSAAYTLGKVYDFYRSAFTRNSYDGKGSSILGIIGATDSTTGKPLANAYWSGTEQWLVFGSADFYAGAPDVVGHEFAHAVDQTTAHLIYNQESGALNESFSDILGEAFESYLIGSNDWIMGTKLKSKIRDMKSPAAFGDPSRMSQYVRTSEDYGGVHTNSGIPNHAFYLLAEGLGAKSIGLKDARDIFYRALETKLNANSDFQDLRSACVLSADELFGSGSTQAVNTGLAFDGVEIFSASVADTPQDLTPPTGADSYLISYMAVDGSTYLGRNEAAKGDGSDVTPLSSKAVSTKTRPSVSGDGLVAVTVTATFDVMVVATDKSYESVGGAPGYFNSISISADAKYLAAVGRSPSTGLATKEIIYTKVSTAASQTIDLYLPVIDGPNSVQIGSVDEVDLSPDGQLAMFDGYATTTMDDGTVVKGWSIFGVDLRTMEIYLLAGPNKDLGLFNPTFARTSSYRATFETWDKASDSSGVWTANMLTGDFVLVKGFNPATVNYAYPRYSAADDKIYYADDFYSYTYSATKPRLSMIYLGADKMSPSGSSYTVLNYAYNGLCYRRGTFMGAPLLSVTAQQSQVGPGDSMVFRIARVSGDSKVKVPLSFKLLGTAQPVIDYQAIGLNAAIPANTSYVDIALKVPSSIPSGSRLVKLSLDPEFHYLISPTAGEASIAIVGKAAPAIVTQPSSQTLGLGDRLVLTVNAGSDSGNSYQWYKDGVRISGASSATFTLSSLTAKDAGRYTCVVTNAYGSTTSAAAEVSVGPSNSIVNVSVRTTLNAGQNLIVGAVVSGGAKDILIRAAGPALSDFGLAGMPDPKLNLYNSASVQLAENDNWASTLSPVFSQVGAFGFKAGSLDAAMSQSLSDAFSVHCKGAQAGTVLVEAYDIKGGVNPRLVNVSARNHVGVKNDVLIAGFSIAGTGTKQVLIRGIGPALAKFGVNGVLADPKIQVFDNAQNEIAQNDNWSSSLSVAFDKVGAFGLDVGSKDAAILVTLQAGSLYSVMLSGVSDGTGEGLIEVYDME